MWFGVYAWLRLFGFRGLLLLCFFRVCSLICVLRNSGCVLFVISFVYFAFCVYFRFVIAVVLRTLFWCCCFSCAFQILVCVLWFVFTCGLCLGWYLVLVLCVLVIFGGWFAFVSGLLAFVVDSGGCLFCCGLFGLVVTCV